MGNDDEKDSMASVGSWLCLTRSAIFLFILRLAFAAVN